jgi:hypothetical protein
MGSCRTVENRADDVETAIDRGRRCAFMQSGIDERARRYIMLGLAAFIGAVLLVALGVLTERLTRRGADLALRGSRATNRHAEVLTRNAEAIAVWRHVLASLRAGAAVRPPHQPAALRA